MIQKPSFRLTLPGSKSITNRVLLCAALAKGVSRVYGALESEDTRVMLEALRALGVRIKQDGDLLEIHGLGGKWKKSSVKLDMKGSGTVTRFLTAILTLTQVKATLTGDDRMRERPMGDLVEALRQLGADIAYVDKEGFLPLMLKKARLSPEASHKVRVKGDKSSQYASALLMAAPFLKAPLTLEIEGDLVSRPYMDVTLAVMKDFGVEVDDHGGRSFTVKPQVYQAREYKVEGDASNAGYWTSIALLHEGEVAFSNLNSPSSQGDISYGEILKKALKEELSEREIDMKERPDTAMTLAVCAPFFQGKTTITGLSTLRIKETDRLRALEAELGKVGVKKKKKRDSLVVREGVNPPASISIDTYNDHRMAMCFAVLGTKVPGIVIREPDCVGKTYPVFWEDLERSYLSPLDLGERNLVLIGMRGSGKTTYGKKIASLLGRDFIDMDEAIEKREGMKIKEIVDRYGWDYFRKVEQKNCSTLGAMKRAVIAAGGGVILDEKGMLALRKNSLVVFLFVSPSVLPGRLSSGGENRPSVTGKPLLDEIPELWKERRDLYLRYADIVWDDTSGKVLEERLEDIFEEGA